MLTDDGGIVFSGVVLSGRRSHLQWKAGTVNAMAGSDVYILSSTPVLLDVSIALSSSFP
jgi:hypothetical protein